MKRTIQFFILITFGATLLSAAPARGGLRTYTQSDGSTFQATLKGDAAFHWMESEGEVIMYNPQDKNYYNAELTPDGKFIMSKQKAGIRVMQSRAFNLSSDVSSTKKSLESKKIEALRRLQHQARQGSHPR